MIKIITGLVFALVMVNIVFADDVEFRLEGAFLKPQNTVGEFDNSAGGNSVRGSSVKQEMDSMESLKFSVIKSLIDNVSIIGSIYTPMKGVMSPKHKLSVLTTDDSYGVAGKYKMLLAQLGGEYTFPLFYKFQPYIGGGLAFAYFYDGGTDSRLHPGGHTIENFDIKNTFTGYLTAGANYNLSNTFSLTGSISYIPLEMDAAYQFSTYVGQGFSSSVARDELDLKINPIIVTLGAKWIF